MRKITIDISSEQNRRGLSGDSVDLVRQRLGLLSGKDKIMMSMYYVDGCSIRRIAGLLEMNEGSLSRRIRKISGRLLSGRYMRCLRNRRFFANSELRTAQDYYVNGQTIGQIAARMGCSYYEVRRVIERIEAILELLEKTDPRPKT
jgi:DNA-directed RNA polymerase specialized sigma24 family protein